MIRRTAALALVLALVGCAREDGGATAAGTPSASDPAQVRTITLDPEPVPSPTGRLYADLRQSSIDASLGRMQVWVRNDTERDLAPTAVRYLDPRFPDALVGGRLRVDPAGSERGYPVVLPDRPRCDPAPGDAGAEPTTGVVEVVTAEGTERIPVEDEADVVERYVGSRCQELALAAVADVSWSDEVEVDRTASPPAGTLELVVRPTGRGGGELVVESVAGSHLLQSAAQPPVWAPGVTVDPDRPVTRVPLPLEPARCDEHAFVEGGGATAFRVRYLLDGEPGEVLLRMSPTGARRAIDFAREACGLG